MKKKAIIFISVITVVAGGVIFARFPAEAKTDASRGNFVLDNGEVAFYEEDIDYMQSEINKLHSDLIEATDDADGTARKENIKSTGIIDYANGTVVIDSSDLTALADEIDELERTYKQFTLAYLNGINTYLDVEGNVTHDIEESDTVRLPSFSELLNGIDLSQEVTTGTTANNLSKNKGAWINGEYVNGNGNDVNEAYARGYKDGVDYATGNANITYSYHKHEGTEGVVGGCYGNVTKSCTGSFEVIRFTHEGDIVHEGTQKFYDIKCRTCGYTMNDWLGKQEVAENFVIRSHSVTEIQLVCGKTTGTIESATITFD